MEARRTPLYDLIVAAGARMIEFGGWDMPLQFSGIRDEHGAVRSLAGIFDLSHMGRLEVTGESASELLQWVLTNDLTKLEVGDAQYTLLCQEEGGILDDLVLYRLDQQRFWLVVNAANTAKDLAWLETHRPPGVEVTDITDRTALLAIQGPCSQELIARLGGGLEQLGYFKCRQAVLDGVECVVARTGYTGEDGFEIVCAGRDAARMWTGLGDLRLAGRRPLPCGLGARDVLRLEAGLKLYGMDMDEKTCPYEVGLGWVVRLKKGEFIGREALEQLYHAGPSREAVGLRMLDRNVPRHGCRVTKGGRPIGKITSGTYSFSLNQGVAMAMVQAAYCRVGQGVGVEIRGHTSPAEIIKTPFYRGSVRTHSGAGWSAHVDQGA